MLESVLIANRGEIACRVIATARRLGMRTIAVYSDADRDALHVRLADEAVRIGGVAPSDSYLRIDRLLDAARRTAAAAVHPGYGFLAENAGFARACDDAGLVFVGPPAVAIDAMGDKARAKALMADAGVPILPGYHAAEQADDALVSAAAEVGFPLLIKPSAGGGGKGMRVVREAGELVDALVTARREARAAFGDDTLLLERYLDGPRHVEVQVFADAHGGVVHLFERDCSVQRRHQKVVEEAPAPGLDPSLRARMGEAAVAAARAIGYRGAGTVEFLLEGDEFWFMEMNTRLQVEHPVTELVTGLDLVEWQLRVAAGEALPRGQSALSLAGHAIEVRLCAEDPAREFLPATGRLAHLKFPTGAGVRVDTGFEAGDTVSSHYDSLLAKLIAHGADREQALARLQRALASLQVVGVTTNAALLSRVIAHEQFRAGGVDTRFLDRYPELLVPPADPPNTVVLLSALALYAAAREEARTQARAIGDALSPWAVCDAWRLNKPGRERLELEHDARHWTVTLEQADDGGVHIGLDEVPAGHAAQPVAERTTGAGTRHYARFDDDPQVRTTVTLDGHRRSLACHVTGDSVTVWHEGEAWSLARRPMSREPENVDAQGSLSSPLPGQVIAVHVAEGDSVSRGQVLMVVEAMKMEHGIRAPDDGTVVRVHYRTGDSVAEGEPLLVIE